MSTELDRIWLDAAARLGMPVERGGDAYVHWDGRVLHIADDAELDHDDTVAQLVLHEICHSIVQGPAQFRAPDWGLDNTTDRDAHRELTAVRLQAHVLGAFGLRARLFPTTSVRTFFEGLPADAIGSDALAREAAARAAREPWQPVLRQALEATAALETAPRHPQSGQPLAAGRCGDCVWRTPGGFCRHAGRRVRAEAQACSRWEAALDCQACAACCRHAYDSVTISRREAARLPGLAVDRGSYVELRRTADNRCAALGGPDGGPWACTVYDLRPRPCRDFELAGRHCLAARRRVGLTF